MIILPVTQGSEQWKEARLGIPTASRFGSIITPKTMKPSSQADGYIAELVAEWILGQPLDGVQTEWMERGSVLEQPGRREPLAVEADNTECAREVPWIEAEIVAEERIVVHEKSLLLAVPWEDQPRPRDLDARRVEKDQSRRRAKKSPPGLKMATPAFSPEVREM